MTGQRVRLRRAPVLTRTTTRRCLAAAAAAVAVGLAIMAARTPRPRVGPGEAASHLVAIVAAARLLPAGTALRPSDLTVEDLPAADVPADAWPAGRPVGDAVLATTLPRGLPITTTALLGAAPGSAGRGLVLAPEPIGVPGVAALLGAGERVDLFTLPTNGLAGALLAQDVLVVAVPHGGDLVEFALTDAQALAIAGPAAAGRVSVAIVPPESAPTPATTGPSDPR